MTPPSEPPHWHPSRSTPEARVRIRELFGQEVHDWMFTTPEPALFALLHRTALADPDDPRLDALSVILVRRLEAGACPPSELPREYREVPS